MQTGNPRFGADLLILPGFFHYNGRHFCDSIA